MNNIIISSSLALLILSVLTLYLIYTYIQNFLLIRRVPYKQFHNALAIYISKNASSELTWYLSEHFEVISDDVTRIFLQCPQLALAKVETISISTESLVHIDNCYFTTLPLSVRLELITILKSFIGRDTYETPKSEIENFILTKNRIK